jgi:hypothetical protein
MLRAAPLLLLLLLLVCDAAAQRNVTVDDTDAGVVYAPAAAWEQGATCLGCGVAGAIDPTRAYGGTWHDTTTGSNLTNGTRTLTLSFTGAPPAPTLPLHRLTARRHGDLPLLHRPEHDPGQGGREHARQHDVCA